MVGTLISLPPRMPTSQFAETKEYGMLHSKCELGKFGLLITNPWNKNIVFDSMSQYDPNDASRWDRVGGNQKDRQYLSFSMGLKMKKENTREEMKTVESVEPRKHSCHYVISSSSNLVPLCPSIHMTKWHRNWSFTVKEGLHYFLA